MSDRTIEQVEEDIKRHWLNAWIARRKLTTRKKWENKLAFLEAELAALVEKENP